jgi:hypothetical protein
MGKKKGKLNWQPISFLPQLAAMIDGMLEAAKESYGPFRQISVHDNYTLKRVSEVTGQQIEDAWLYDTQLDKWSKLSGLKQAQRDEIKRLQEQMDALKKVNRDIMAIVEEHKDKTIEKVMAKSDVELGLEFLMGKRKH